ncbi:AAA family ATPase [Sphaerisporangium sp. NPDC005288]|uniref:AAA family ATPase n=1 Tax=Sphaerisporangium sp. NPDC005288 TaxID=3155114 RepID=UPI0033B539C0
MAIILSENRLVTCAHVVERLVEDAQDALTNGREIVVHIGWPLSPGAVGRARVMSEWWRPKDPYGRGDLSILEILDALPDTAEPAPLADISNHEGHLFKAYGLPEDDLYLVSCDGAIRGYEGPGGTWVRLEGRAGLGRTISPGFSGTAVWDQSVEAVVGMVVARDQVLDARGGFFIPMAEMVKSCPVIANYAPTSFERSIDAREHWIPRARGVSSSAESGWYFTGRETIYRELTANFFSGAAISRRLYCVTGGPGSGKSAILARLPVLGDRRLAKHAQRNSYERTLEHVDVVAIYLRQKNFLEVLDEIGRALGYKVETFDQLQQAIAKNHRRTTRPLALILDGLDEAADPNTRDRLARELVKQLGYYAGELRLTLIVSCRSGIPGSENEKLVEALGSRRHVLTVDKPPYIDRKELQNYVEARLLGRASDGAVNPYEDRPKYAATLAKEVAAAAYPNFLVAQLVARSLLDDPVTTEHRLAQKKFPSTVADALSDYLARFGEDRQRATDLLTGLAYARGSGFPVSDLWLLVTERLTGSQYSKEDLKWLLNSAAAFLIESIDDDRHRRYRLYHQALVDVLQSLGGQHIVYDFLAEYCLAVEDAEIIAYLREHLSGHALSAERLDHLLTNPRLLSLCNARGVLRDSARADVALTSDAINARVALAAKAHTLDLASSQAKRSAYLGLASHQYEVPALEEHTLKHWWRCYWGEWQSVSEHEVLLRGEFVARLSTVLLDDEYLIVAGDDNGYIRIIDPITQTTRFERKLDSAVTALHVVDASRTPNFLVGTEGGIIWVIKISRSGLRVDKAAKIAGVVSALSGALPTKGDLRILAGSTAGTLLFQRRRSGRRVEERRKELRTQISDISFFGRRGLFALVGQRDGRVEVYMLPELRQDPGYGLDIQESIKSVFVTPSPPDQGQSVLVATQNYIREWNLDFGVPVNNRFNIPGDGNAVVSFELNQVEMLLASDNEVIRVLPWKVSGNELTLRGHDESIRDLSSLVIEGRNYVVSSSDDGTVRLWPIDIRNEQTELRNRFEAWTININPYNHESIAMVDVHGRMRIEPVGGSIKSPHVGTVDDIQFLKGQPIRAYRKGGRDGGTFIEDVRVSESLSDWLLLVVVSNSLIALAQDDLLILGEYSPGSPSTWRAISRIGLSGDIRLLHAARLGADFSPAVVAVTEISRSRRVQVFDSRGRALIPALASEAEKYIEQNPYIEDEISDASAFRASNTDWLVYVGLSQITLIKMGEDENEWEEHRTVQRTSLGFALLEHVHFNDRHWLILLQSGAILIMDALKLSLVDTIDLGGGHPLALAAAQMLHHPERWAVTVGMTTGTLAFEIDLSVLANEPRP